MIHAAAATNKVGCADVGRRRNGRRGRKLVVQLKSLLQSTNKIGGLRRRLRSRTCLAKTSSRPDYLTFIKTRQRSAVV